VLGWLLMPRIEVKDLAGWKESWRRTFSSLTGLECGVRSDNFHHFFHCMPTTS
jgi:hypothetical protein